MKETLEQAVNVVELTMNQSKLKQMVRRRESFDQQNLEIGQKVFETVEKNHISVNIAARIAAGDRC